MVPLLATYKASSTPRPPAAQTTTSPNFLTLIHDFAVVRRQFIMDYSRPYRSKRHPPCDQCRRKKLRCDRNAENTCQRCLQRNTPCSFNQSQPIEPSPSTVLPGPVPHPAPDPAPNPAPAPASVPSVFSDPPLFPIGTSIDLPFITESTPGRFGQTIQTLDQLPGFSTQVIGASGESDPWLLRHCRFDDRGFLRFHQVHFRNAGGVPLDEKIPVHFLVTAEGLYDASKEAAGFSKRALAREELEALVPGECGQRLVALYAFTPCTQTDQILTSTKASSSSSIQHSRSFQDRSLESRPCNLSPISKFFATLLSIS